MPSDLSPRKRLTAEDMAKTELANALYNVLAARVDPDEVREIVEEAIAESLEGSDTP